MKMKNYFTNKAYIGYGILLIIFPIIAILIFNKFEWEYMNSIQSIVFTIIYAIILLLFLNNIDTKKKKLRMVRIFQILILTMLVVSIAILILKICGVI